MAWLPHINSGTNRRSRAGGNLEPGAGFSQPTGKISRTSASIRRSRAGGNLEPGANFSQPTGRISRTSASIRRSRAGGNFEQGAILSHPRNLAGLLVTFFALVAIAALSGCAAAAPAPTATPEPTAVPATEVPQQAPTAVSPAAPAGNPFAVGDEINPILATTILNPGEQRVSFLLVGKKAIIKAPEAAIAATFQGQGEAPTQEATAIYHDWPFGIRGAYSARMTFDRPGPWQLKVSVEDGEVSGETVIDLKVVEESPVPAIGQRPPLSRTKTLADVAGVEQLTTDYNADEDLYQLTVAQAVESPRPAVVVFASPAFCTSATCGPQVDTVKELKNAFADRADFVHVEIYDQPEEIQGDLSKARFAPAVDEWGFSSVPHWFNESWVYILDEKGLADHRFEGFVSLTELETALKETLGET